MTNTRRSRFRTFGLYSLVPSALAILGACLLGSRESNEDKYNRVQVGMTETEVEEIYGPAIVTVRSIVKPEEVRRRKIPNVPEGQGTTTTNKGWYYDEDHFFEVEFDETGVAFFKSRAVVSEPRTAWGRWLRKMERICYHGWVVFVPATLFVIVILAWFWHLSRIARKRATTPYGPDADFREFG